MNKERNILQERLTHAYRRKRLLDRLAVCGLLLAGILLSFFVLFLLDYTVRFPAPVRVLLTLAVGAIFCWWVPRRKWRQIWPKREDLVAIARDAEMMARRESTDKGFFGVLVSAVEFTGGKTAPSGSEQLKGYVVDQAQQDAFNPMRLTLHNAALLKHAGRALAMLFGLYAAWLCIGPNSFGVFFLRSLGLSSMYLTRTQFVEPFNLPTAVPQFKDIPVEIYVSGVIPSQGVLRVSFEGENPFSVPLYRAEASKETKPDVADEAKADDKAEVKAEVKPDVKADPKAPKDAKVATAEAAKGTKDAKPDPKAKAAPKTDPKAVAATPGKTDAKGTSPAAASKPEKEAAAPKEVNANVIRTVAPAGAVLFRTVIREPSRPLRFTARLGDAESHEYAINVVKPPFVKGGNIEIRPPAYTGLPASKMEIGDFEVLEQSEMDFSIVPDRKVKSARLEYDDKSVPMQSQGDAWVLTKQTFDKQNVRYSILLVDDIGIENTDRMANVIRVTADRLPVVTLPRPLGGGYCSSASKIRWQLKTSDDYGLKQVLLHYSICRELDGGAKQVLSEGDVINKQYATESNKDAKGGKEVKEKAEKEVTLSGVWDLSGIKAESGQVLVLQARACDFKPNRKKGEEWGLSPEATLRIVSTEEMRAMLEAEMADLNKTMQDLSSDMEKQNDTLKNEVSGGGKK